MSQVTDRTVGANPTGFDMRTELNNIIGALETCNSGTSEPLNTVQFMYWFDTSNSTYYYLKQRNHDNTEWNTILRYTVATKAIYSMSNGVVIDDTTVVHKTGDETIAGVKTFNSNTIFNGNVGIGTQSPAAKLDLLAQNNATDETIFRAGIADVADGLTITKDSSSNITLSYTNKTSPCLNIDSSGNILSKSPTGGLGYGIGAGGTVTQLTSKSTAVTLNKPCGQIIMNNASLAAGAVATFNFSNSLLSGTDIITVEGVNTGGVDPYNYDIQVRRVTGGACTVYIKNITAGALAGAITLNFVIIKGAEA